MKFLFFTFFMLCSLTATGQSVHTSWNDQFVKEIHVTCSLQESFCYDLCDSFSTCVIEEKTCRSCIGTGLAIQRILSELGRTVRFNSRLSSTMPVLNLIKNGNFFAISARDAFNVLDAFDSISVLRKFESLCPGESDDQLLFIEVDEVSRKILHPRFVFCRFENLGEFFELHFVPTFSKMILPRIF